MPSLESLKKKIGSAEDLQTVVRTMKTLAAVSIRQYETAAESLAHYSKTVDLGMAMLLWQARDLRLAGTTPSGGPTGAIVFGSDQGLCGPFNDHLAQFISDRRVDANDGRPWRFMAVGVRIASRLQDAKEPVDALLGNASSAAGITPLIHELLRQLDDWRTEHRLERILVFHNRRTSSASYAPHAQQLLPLTSERLAPHRHAKWPTRSLPLVTMDPTRFFSNLVHQYLFVTLFRACAESLAGENASRIASMQSAEQSIEARLGELRGEYNQLRQTAITEELLEVVTGFEVLRQQARRTPPDEAE